MTKIIFFFVFLVCVTNIEATATVSISDTSGAFDSITNSSSSQDVLNVVSSLENGNLDAGADKVLKELHGVIENLIDNVTDDTIEKLNNGDCRNCKSMFEGFLKSINRNLHQQLDENHPEKSVLSFMAKNSDKFLQNVTKTEYEIMDVLKELSNEFNTNKVDTDKILSIIITIYDEIIYKIQIYAEKIAETLKKLSNANNATIVDEIVKAGHDLINETKGVLIAYNNPLEDAKKCLEDAASGKNTQSLKNIVRDVEKKGQTSITVDDLIEALEADKPSKFYSLLQIAILQEGCILSSEVNNITNSKVLKNIIDSLQKNDHKETLTGITREFNETKIFKNFLGHTLKSEILTIKNPSLGSVFQLVLDYPSELVNEGLKKARELVENGHPKDSEESSSSESKEKSTSSSGESGESSESHESSSGGESCQS